MITQQILKFLFDFFHFLIVLIKRLVRGSERVDSLRVLGVVVTSHLTMRVGHGGALVETTPFDRRVVGSDPALAAM